MRLCMKTVTEQMTIELIYLLYPPPADDDAVTW